MELLSDGAASGAHRGMGALAQSLCQSLCRMPMQQDHVPGPGLAAAWPGAGWGEPGGAWHGTCVGNPQPALALMRCSQFS